MGQPGPETHLNNLLLMWYPVLLRICANHHQVPNMLWAKSWSVACFVPAPSREKLLLSSLTTTLMLWLLILCRRSLLFPLQHTFCTRNSARCIIRPRWGASCLSETTYEQVAYNHVRVRGAEWEPEAEGEYTLKVKAACTTGYFTTFVGAFRDPILINQLHGFLGTVEDLVREKMGSVPFDLKIHRYGVNGVMGELEVDKRSPMEVCVVVQARAETQEIANQVASGCKFGFMHLPYKGQVATAGNFAWPFTPCEMPGGPLSEFCIYHIMHKCDPVALCPIKASASGDLTLILSLLAGNLR